MRKKAKQRPSPLLMAFFRWYCREGFLEELEGDLLEHFYGKFAQSSSYKAQILLAKEVVLLFRPGIVEHPVRLLAKILPDMKKLQWLQLALFNAVVLICMFLPFLPGPYDKMAQGLSMTAQAIGLFGLLLIPIGVLWVIQEIKKVIGQNSRLNHWSSGYYYAISAAIASGVIYPLLTLCLLISVGASAAIASLAFGAIAAFKIVPAIRQLKDASTQTFNAAPLYLISVPMIAFTVRLLLILPASEYSRNYAIEKGQMVIDAIEDYYTKQSRYPESIDQIYDLSKPSIMGISNFEYEKNGDGYNLFFVQWQHIGATREVVMYNKRDEHNVKGHFASYELKQPHWRYYWLD